MDRDSNKANACLFGSDTSSESVWNPELHRTLAAFGLDVDFYRGQGSHLFYRSCDGGERRVVDFVAGYGAVLFGHNTAPLVDQVRSFFEASKPMFCQASRPAASADLAEQLAARCGGGYRVCFGSTGAQAVEIALQHAMLETGKRRFLVLERAFHGKSIGTRALTCDADELSTPNTVSNSIRVPCDDPEGIVAAIAEATDIAGCIFEPILGEGGVRPLSRATLATLSGVCRDAGIPLIADECQTGVGRTGSFLACEQLGVAPDYILLSKALGGGIAKISACLIKSDRYVASFDWHHTSTFAADNLSSILAQRVLDLLDDAALKQIRKTGQSILRRLRELQAQFPSVIADVRGAGLMMGIEFHRQDAAESFLTRVVHSHELATHLVAAYLFHRHGIRTAPTLSDPCTLRIHGMLCTSEMDWEQLFNGLEDVCCLLADEDASELLQQAIPADSQTDRVLGLGHSWIPFREGISIRPVKQHRNRRGRRVAWLCHLVDATDIAENDASFARLSDPQREQLLADMLPFAKPVVMSTKAVCSATGDKVQLIPIMLPATSRMFRSWMDRKDLRRAKSLVADGIQVAESLACEVVSLGQYTSIVSRNGLGLQHADIGLTTGNAFAAALTVDAVIRLIQEERIGLDVSRLTLGVVGGNGNIGRVLVESLGHRFARTIFCTSSHPRSTMRLQRLAESLEGSLVVSDLGYLQEADVILSCVNSTDPILSSEHFKLGAIVCDVSVPCSVDPAVVALRSDVRLIKGGVVQLPGNEDLGIASFPLPRGRTYGCMAEGILLGLEGRIDKHFTGTLRTHHLQEVRGYAEKHGFALADYKTQCVFGSTREGIACDAGK